MCSALPAAAQYVSSLSMESTPADEYPFVSMVLNKEAGPLCTGTLVGSRTVLTAASCVAAGGSQPEPDLVFVGMSNIFLDPFRRGAAEVVDGRRFCRMPAALVCCPINWPSAARSAPALPTRTCAAATAGAAPPQAPGRL